MGSQVRKARFNSFSFEEELALFCLRDEPLVLDRAARPEQHPAAPRPRAAHVGRERVVRCRLDPEGAVPVGRDVPKLGGRAVRILHGDRAVELERAGRERLSARLVGYRVRAALRVALERERARCPGLRGGRAGPDAERPVGREEPVVAVGEGGRMSRPLMRSLKLIANGPMIDVYFSDVRCCGKLNFCATSLPFPLVHRVRNNPVLNSRDTRWERLVIGIDGKALFLGVQVLLNAVGIFLGPFIGLAISHKVIVG